MTYTILIEPQPKGDLRANSKLISIKESKGIIRVLNHSQGYSHTPYSSIDATGSVRGMKDRGYWKKEDKTVRAHGFIYNVSHLLIDDELDALSYGLEKGLVILDKQAVEPYTIVFEIK